MNEVNFVPVSRQTALPALDLEGHSDVFVLRSKDKNREPGEPVQWTGARLIEDFCKRSETKSPMSGQFL